MNKSSRHNKIIGNFGEYLMCNWLSRSGFEVALVDHTGIDIVAYNKDLDLRIGITVKSRTRENGTQNSSVNLFREYISNSNKSDRKKVVDACRVFGCEPWIGIYVETNDYADLYLTSLLNYDNKYRCKKQVSASQSSYVDDWKMTSKYTMLYDQDQEVKHIKIQFEEIKWNW